MVLPSAARRNSSHQEDLSRFRSSLDRLRNRLDARLEEWLEARAESAAEVAPQAKELVETLSDLILSGGKRLRPALVYHTYIGCGGRDDEVVFPLALATEFLHTYLLVHDDIMDHADVRRGRPAAHVRFRDLHREHHWQGNAEDYGEAVGILVGDLAHVYAVEAFSQAVAISPRQEELRRSFFAMEEEVIAGQHLEMRVAVMDQVDEPTLEEVLRLKSGRYTVERPIQLGALLAEASPSQIGALSRCGVALGEAFQLRDDILGLFGDPEKVGKPVGGDLIESKLTFPVFYALEMASAEDRRVVEAALGNAELTASEVQRVCQIIVDCGALARVRGMIEDRVASARQALREIDLTGESKSFFEGLMSYIGERDR